VDNLATYPQKSRLSTDLLSYPQKPLLAAIANQSNVWFNHCIDQPNGVGTMTHIDECIVMIAELLSSLDLSEGWAAWYDYGDELI
jgi:hypothetical protein